MKRSFVLCFPLFCVALLAAFTVPGMDERKKAVGSLFHLSPDLKAAFEPGDDFAPLPKPGGFDWLASHKEEGQSYDQFLKSRPNKPGAGGRKFIYLQPVGEFPEGAPEMETLRKYLEAYFYPMPVKLSKALILKPSAAIQTRGEQVHSTDLLNALQKRVPRDAHVMMAVTMKDLYPGPAWNFVFGVARLKQRCGVFSFARYGVADDRKRALLRALKVISHETGHAFGIKHCVHFHCLMNGSNSLDETDRAPLYFCPACLRKIHWGLKFQPGERYQKLSDFLEGNGLKEEAKWFVKRAEKTR
ncbi:MAG: archaemetzincin [Akkermansiaceae bacterium]|jgi:archaemetzincin